MVAFVSFQRPCPDDVAWVARHDQREGRGFRVCHAHRFALGRATPMAAQKVFFLGHPGFLISLMWPFGVGFEYFYAP